MHLKLSPPLIFKYFLKDWIPYIDFPVAGEIWFNTIFLFDANVVCFCLFSHLFINVLLQNCKMICYSFHWIYFHNLRLL